MDKEKKKQIKKESKTILKTLFPDHLKRINENSDWCGTVSKSKGKKLKKRKTLEFWD